MTNLNCTARNCVNNEGGLCGAEYIMIQGAESTCSPETFCSNFKADDILNQVSAINNTDYIGEIFQILSGDYDIKTSPTVACHAQHCFYYANGICGAQNISIRGNGASNERDTSCETFVE